jgi:hypothetical protein
MSIDPGRLDAFKSATPIERQVMLYEGLEDIKNMAEEIKCIRKKVTLNTIKIYSLIGALTIAGIVIALAAKFGG